MLTGEDRKRFEDALLWTFYRFEVLRKAGLVTGSLGFVPGEKAKGRIAGLLDSDYRPDRSLLAEIVDMFSPSNDTREAASLCVLLLRWEPETKP
jgi:hypothetical protein